jgi:hypothetical protein
MPATGRAIFETAKASVDHSAFGDAWRTYEANTGFRGLSEHERALIRVAFVSGWRAAMVERGR